MIGEAERNLDQLRQQFPAWTITTRWVTAGPGQTSDAVWRRSVILVAWDAAELAREIRRQEGES